VIVGVAPKDPVYLPPAATFDLRVERSFELGRDQRIQLTLDCFNLFNAKAVTNADYHYDPGKVTAVQSPSRKLRLGISYEF